MKLGESMRRRRAGVGRTRKFAVRVLLGVVLAALGFWGGYGLATEILFPAPEPPGELVEVPDLRGDLLVEARGRIDETGMTPGRVEFLKHPTVPAGSIVGQSPLPGQSALPGDSLRLSVSLGPDRRPVPDVSRLPGERARTVLEATGFQVVVDSVDAPLPRGTVMELDPLPGTEADLPAEVRMTVSLGPPRVVMPVLLGLRRDEALGTLDSLGLVVAGIESRIPVRPDEAIVVEQDPPPGEMVERGSAVRIFLGDVRGW